MLLTMKHDDLLRLERARGLTIEVVSGRAWMTESGVDADRFLAPGRRHRLAGDGVVLIGPGDRAQGETCVRLLPDPVRGRILAALAHAVREWEVYRVTRLLRRLDDATLRDIGFRRTCLADEVRERLAR
jgi:uncharacterized protein YjiS (DUF1127 family)